MRFALPSARFVQHRKPRLRLMIACAVCVLSLFLLAACSKPPQAANDVPSAAPKETGLETIPDPDPKKYPKYEDLSGWKNPYFVVRDDGIGRVDLDNREVHILQPEQIPAELATLGRDAWPYGRVVLVTQATPKNPTEQAKTDLRKNRALLVGTLKELNVEMKEFP